VIVYKALAHPKLEADRVVMVATRVVGLEVLPTMGGLEV
jgi:hypothetical protein